MPILTVSDLLTVTTQSDAFALELAICSALGLPTTAWQPLSPEIAILGVNSELVATYSGNINQIAAGGYASSAATIAGSGTAIDAAGFATTWMDLVSVNVYNVTRVPATFATGTMPVANTSAISYPFVVGQLHFQNPFTGATYTNTAPGTIPPATASFAIAVQADAGYPGGSGTFPAGDTPILLTPLSGVSPLVVPVSLIGSDIELNSALLIRCQNKLGSLSPNGPEFAYQFVATSIPTPATASVASFPFNQPGIPTVTAPITRVATLLNILTGNVGVYIANAAGAPSGADVTAVFTAIQQFCVPLSVTTTVAAVGTVALNIQYRVWIQASSGITVAQAMANVNAAVATFCAGVPIGGYSTTAPNILPYDDLIDVIFNANKGTIDLQLLNPPGNLPIGTTSVPVPGVPSLASQVFFV